MAMVEYHPILSDEVINEIKSLLPDFAKEALEYRDKLRKEISELVADIVSKTVEGIVILITKLIRSIGYIVGEYEIQKELGKRDALRKERITLLNTQEAYLGLLRGKLSNREFEDELASLGYSDDRIEALKEIYRRPLTVGEIQTAYMLGIIGSNEAIQKFKELGISEDDSYILLTQATRILSPDQLINLWLRGSITDSELEDSLKRHGYNIFDVDKIKELAYYIPSPPDLIRMAVREVFTPEIAEKFGQFEDFPEAFLEWANKQGISEFWAKAYWAAHWELPSLTMGYEMLHRGVITEDELKMLMRAQDVMPFWRDKLIQISYNPLTRVDVRRMYKLGVLDRDEVKRAYLDLGYNEENAERLTQFTELEVKEETRDLTKAEIITAYKNGLVNEYELMEYLKGLGYDDNEAELLKALADISILNTVKQAKIKSIKNRYLKGTITESEAIRALTAIPLTANEIDRQMDIFNAEKETMIAHITVEDVKKAFKYGIIDENTAIDKLKHLGYTEDDIKIILEIVRKEMK